MIIEGLEQRALGSSIGLSEITESKPPTIAVMPFKNMTNDEEQEYLSLIHI